MYDRVIRMLKEADVQYEATEHEPVRTSWQAAKVRGVPLRTGVKAMVLKTLEGNLLLVLIPADRRVDMKKMAELEKTSYVSLASPEEVFGLTGCRLGAVPPFGHKTKLKTYMHKAILENEQVNFNAGLRTRSVRMRSKDLEKFIKPVMF